MDSGVGPCITEESDLDGDTQGDEFGRKLQAARERCGLSRKVLAERLGVSAPTVWHWETKGRHPRPKLVPALTRALGIDEGWFYSDGSGGIRPKTVGSIIEEAREQIAAVTGIDANEVTLKVKLAGRARRTRPGRR